MGKVGDFLVVFIMTKTLCGRGPAILGLLLALSIPAGLLLVLIGVLHPEGLAGFAIAAFRTVLRGFH